MNTCRKLLSTDPARNPQALPRRKTRQKQAKKSNKKHARFDHTRRRHKQPLEGQIAQAQRRDNKAREHQTHEHFAMINGWLFFRAHARNTTMKEEEFLSHVNSTKDLDRGVRLMFWCPQGQMTDGLLDPGQSGSMSVVIVTVTLRHATI